MPLSGRDDCYMARLHTESNTISSVLPVSRISFGLLLHKFHHHLGRLNAFMLKILHCLQVLRRMELVIDHKANPHPLQILERSARHLLQRSYGH